MTHTYIIEGMTCGKCVAKVRSELLKIGDISDVELQLEAPQATLSMLRHVETKTLQSAIAKAGPYTIREDGHPVAHHGAEAAASVWTTYKPVLVLFAVLFAGTVLPPLLAGRFEFESWMQQFMGGFFLGFSFFKLFDLNGFADAFTGYDVLARKWRGWALAYPFVEFGLGLLLLSGIQPVAVNGIVFVVMTVGSIGVVQAVRSKRAIQCACLGAVFNLPMSRITLIENGLMIAMSAWMLIALR